LDRTGSESNEDRDEPKARRESVSTHASLRHPHQEAMIQNWSDKAAGKFSKP
jgi:hypothetical protein